MTPAQDRAHQRRDPPGPLGRAQRRPRSSRPGPPGRSCSAPAPATPTSATRSPSSRCSPGDGASSQVEEPDGWRDWQEVDTFVASRADDRHFTVDYAAGSVDVRRHAACRSSASGSGCSPTATAAGWPATCRPGPSTRISGVGGVTVANPLPAAGGADAASLTEALDAIPAEVHRRDRAVIADDFRDLAREVTGVGRAETLPLLHPDTPTADAARGGQRRGLPARTSPRPGAPLPDLGLLRRVARYLDARRLVTTELYVIPPTYREIAVSVGLAVRDGYQVDAVRRWVELILRQYLAPLPPYGPDGAGWPLGRTVRRAELEAVAVQVEGVDSVDGDLQLARLARRRVAAGADGRPGPLGGAGAVGHHRRVRAPAAGRPGYAPPPDPDPTRSRAAAAGGVLMSPATASSACCPSPTSGRAAATTAPPARRRRAWSSPGPSRPDTRARPGPAEPAGLAFDRWCRAYRSGPRTAGSWSCPAARAPPPPRRPACSPAPRARGRRRQRLYVAEAGRSRVLVVDLWAQRLLRTVATTVATDGPSTSPPTGTGCSSCSTARPASSPFEAAVGPIPAGRRALPGTRPCARRASSATRPRACWCCGATPTRRQPSCATSTRLRAWRSPTRRTSRSTDARPLVVARGPGLPFRAWADRSDALGRARAPRRPRVRRGGDRPGPRPARSPTRPTVVSRARRAARRRTEAPAGC